MLKQTFSLIICIALFCMDSSAQSPCDPNIDFESGNFSNWYLSTGSCCPITTSPVPFPVATRHSITTGAGVDMYGGFPVVDPTVGVFSLKLGNNSVGAEAEGALYYLRVPASTTSKYSLIFRYAVVFEDPGHALSEQPRFEVKAFDSATGAPIACAQYTFISQSGLPGFVKSSVTPEPMYKPWASANVDLSSAAGRTVVLSFATGDCDLSGHFGYAYVDINCGLFETYGVDCLDGNLTTLNAPPGYQSYQWWDQSFTTFYGNGQTIQIATPATTTTFGVVVTPFPGFGCADTFFTTREGSNLTVKANRDTTVCIVDGNLALQLNAAATSTKTPIAYEWTPTTGLSCTNCSNPIATFGLGNYSYVVKVTDDSRCLMRDTVKIAAVKTVFADIQSDKDTVCESEEVWIKNLLPNPAGNTYFWSTDLGKLTGLDTNNGNGRIRWSSPGLKKVKLQVLNAACQTDDSALIYVKPMPINEFEILPNTCINKPTELLPRNESSWYYWTIDGAKITDTVYKQKYILSWSDTGMKKLRLRMVGKNGCEPPVKGKTVFVHGVPPSEILPVDNSKLCFGDKIEMKAAYYRDFNYDWEPADYFDNNNFHETTFKIEKTTTVTLNVTDRYGCTGTDSVTIAGSLCCKVFIPDAFTPDNKGQNNKFKPIGINYHKIHTFIIKNRWGQPVFETNSNNDAWDGSFNGKPQPVGTYTYYLKYICDDKDVVERKGTVTLIR